jgi:hypothetical protein
LSPWIFIGAVVASNALLDWLKEKEIMTNGPPSRNAKENARWSVPAKRTGFNPFYGFLFSF